MKMKSFRPSVSILENRDMMSIDLSGGMLTIQGDKPQGNVSQITIIDNTVHVTLNDQVADFDINSVGSITYMGGISGGDVFLNYSNIESTDVGYSNGNVFVGGTNMDTFILVGDYNYVYDLGGGFNVISFGQNNYVWY
jgi:hypothetical protein